MKRKIHKSLILLTTFALVLTAVFLVYSFYNFYFSKEKQDVKNYANIIANSIEESNYESISSILQPLDSNTRVSLIKNNGEVIFDSRKRPDEMENHLNRSEVQDALKNGKGESVRFSTTLEQNTYYYAILLSDNSILRVALETNNILSVFMTILPSVFIVVLILLFLSLFISHFLSRKILSPIESITNNMDNLVLSKDLNTLDIYDELLPFIQTLVKQREEIEVHIDNITEKANIMDTITTNMQEGLVLIDKDKNILSTNESSIKLLNGNTSKSYLSQSFLTLSRNIDLNNSIDKAIATRDHSKINIELNNKYIEIFINPILNNEDLIGLVIFLVDFTKEYKAEIVRKEFSANVSHELKTPLTSIIGYAEMIEGGLVEGQDINKFASIIRKEGGRLLNLIDSIIKLSKLESNSSSSPMEDLNIYLLSKNVISNLEIIAREKNISLNLHGQETHILGNQIMIEELIYNLLDNGIKYTKPNGYINVKVFEENQNAIIEVVDNGIGIALEDQDRIFERFFMVEKSRSKKTQSSGLGLSIVKHIVEYHKGTISLKSEVNKGTEISVSFPLYN